MEKILILFNYDTNGERVRIVMEEEKESPFFKYVTFGMLFGIALGLYTFLGVPWGLALGFVGGATIGIKKEFDEKDSSMIEGSS